MVQIQKNDNSDLTKVLPKKYVFLKANIQTNLINYNQVIFNKSFC
jgi:hypothetical protein